MEDLQQKKDKRNIEKLSIKKLLGLKRAAFDPKKRIRLFKLKRNAAAKKPKERPTFSLLREIYKEDKDVRKSVKKFLGWSTLYAAGQGTYGWFNGQITSALTETIKAGGGLVKPLLWCGSDILRSNAVEFIYMFSDNSLENLKGLITTREQNRIRKRLYEQPQKFTAGKNSVELVRYAEQAAGAKASMMTYGLYAARCAMAAGVAAGVLVSVSPQAALFCAGGVAGSLVVIKGATALIRRGQNIVRRFENRAAAKQHDFTENTPSVKTFKLERKAADIVDESISTAEKAQRKLRNTSLWLYNACSMSFSLGISGVACYMGIKAGLISHEIGNCMAIIGSTGVLFGRCNMGINHWRNVLRHKNDYLDCSKKLEPPENMRISSGNEKLSYENSKIELKDVCFSYQQNGGKAEEAEDRKKVFHALKDINLTFEKGDLNVIIGPSGHGKTTLVNLIRHLDDVGSGSITIGGVDVNNVSQDEIRKYSVMMEQENAFFKTYSAKENLWMLIPNEEDLKEAEAKLSRGEMSEEKYKRMVDFYNHPEEKIDEALRYAQVYELYHDGKNKDKPYEQFSGGEKQRLALARAVLADREITIFDEPTAALDAETSMDIVIKFKEFAKTHNTIMITHSPDIAANAGKVVVIEEGKVTGVGDAYSLVKNNDFIKTIFKGSPRQILEARKEMYRIQAKDTQKTEQAIVKETVASAQYEALKYQFEFDKKSAFGAMRKYVREFHEKDKASDAGREANRMILSEKNELSDAYVQAQKREIKARRRKGR